MRRRVHTRVVFLTVAAAAVFALLLSAGPGSVAKKPPKPKKPVVLQGNAYYKGKTSQGRNVFVLLSPNGRRITRYIFNFRRAHCNFGNGELRYDRLVNIPIGRDGRFSKLFLFKIKRASASKKPPKKRSPGTIQGGGLVRGSVKARFSADGKRIRGIHFNNLRKAVRPKGLVKGKPRKVRVQRCRQKITFRASMQKTPPPTQTTP